MDPALASFFADRLAAERKSLAQLERLWQETIVIPFTNLHVDRRAVGRGLKSMSRLRRAPFTSTCATQRHLVTLKVRRTNPNGIQN
jgi:hypothetical protein